MKYRFFLAFTALFFSFFSKAQNSLPKGWHLMDFEKDSFYGISLKKAYQFLQDKKLKPTPVIVGVLDSGLDTLNEDLKNVLWHNPKEIPFNNIDDDNNGYVDDVYGWNFLGNKNGQNVIKTEKETTRFYHQYKEKFNKEIDLSKLSSEEKRLHKLWKKSAKLIDGNEEKKFEAVLLKMTLNSIKTSTKTLKTALNAEDFTPAQIEKYNPKNNAEKASKQNYLTDVLILSIDNDEYNSTIISQLETAIENLKKEDEAGEKEPENERKKIINDDYFNFDNKFYGNNNITAKDPTHGTHVSGIIAAERNNNLGVDGVADNAKILSVRVVPDGDEYDKDVALGIFYAANNGAKIINMSFGKEISPEKYWVDSAYKYAASKDVLLVHAAGNESSNIDTVQSFPNIHFISNEVAKNVITVGASTDAKFSGVGYVADFSNYGKKEVDVFAPGVKIYSTMPGASNYANQKGTSMAAPVVSGIAALLRSYFPSLTALQVKEIIEKSVAIPVEKEELKISILGASVDAVKLKNACKTGGIVNAAKAVELAYKVVFEKK